ncbi:MAG: histidine kinase [Bacteroidota bacterium]
MNWLPSRRTWLQILFWGLLWIATPFLLTGVSGGENQERYLYHSMVLFAGTVIVIYTNVEILIPKLFFAKKQIPYLVAGTALVALITFLDEWEITPWEQYFDRTAPPRRAGGRQTRGGAWQFVRTVSYFMPYLTAFASSALIEIASYANQKDKEAADSRSEKLESEMKFLKSQFNPHFLFNALNNIYTLSIIKSDKTPDNLLKLSGMLRYMLYDCKADRVTLGKEITYLKHFIDLHLLKDSRGMNVEVELDESRPDVQVAPMLFVPFIENAFKHSRVEDLENGWIKINLKVVQDDLIFKVKNGLPKEEFTKDKVGGIGLGNVRRQLELTYPNEHDLDIQQTDHQFSVCLKIKLK